MEKSGNLPKPTDISLKPTVMGVGIRDLPSSLQGKPKQSYVVWRNILRRCYDDNSHPNYNDCSV